MWRQYFLGFLLLFLPSLASARDYVVLRGELPSGYTTFSALLVNGKATVALPKNEVAPGSGLYDWELVTVEASWDGVSGSIKFGDYGTGPLNSTGPYSDGAGVGDYIGYTAPGLDIVNSQATVCCMSSPWGPVSGWLALTQEDGGSGSGSGGGGGGIGNPTTQPATDPATLGKLGSKWSVNFDDQFTRWGNRGNYFKPYGGDANDFDGVKLRGVSNLNSGTDLWSDAMTFGTDPAEMMGRFQISKRWWDTTGLRTVFTGVLILAGLMAGMVKVLAEFKRSGGGPGA